MKNNHIKQYLLNEKSNSRFYKICNLPHDYPQYDEVMKRHSEAINKDEFYYVDPISSIEVFTAKYLSERGCCCGSGCRYCPYGE